MIKNPSHKYGCYINPESLVFLCSVTLMMLLKDRFETGIQSDGKVSLY